MMFDRRSLLGAGALAPLWLQAPKRAHNGEQVGEPLRLIYVYAPNGLHGPDLRPKAGAPQAELPPMLASMADLAGQFSVLRGLDQDLARPHGDGPGDHARAAACYLTGVHPLKKDGRIRLGESVDQVAARLLGDQTALRSLVLGLESSRSSGECDSGYACSYSSHISWENETTPAGKETDAARAFDRLFRGGLVPGESQRAAERSARRRLVVDLLRGEPDGWSKGLGQAARARLERYSEALLELERSLSGEAYERVDFVSDEQRPEQGQTSYAERAKTMNELIRLALATDRTRVVSFMLANEGSNRNYPEIGVGEGHHSISHHGSDPEKLTQLRRINGLHTDLFGDLVRRLAATPVASEAGGSLLDHCAVVFGSGILDGDRHDHHDLPVVLAGGFGGHIEHPELSRALPEHTPLNDLHRTLLHHLGAEVESLGDSSGALLELS